MQSKTNRNNQYSVTAIVLSLLLVGCGSGSGDDDPDAGAFDPGAGAFTERLASSPTPRSCSVTDLNTWVHESMQDYYLFYSQVDRNLDPATFESPEEFIRELRVQPNDTFSYVTDEVTYNAFFSDGETFGYGWNFARDENDVLLFSLIAPNSPLALAGVQRGEQLVSINGFSIDEFSALTSTQQNEILGVDDEVKTLDLVVANTAQQSRDVEVTKAIYDLQTVLDTRVISDDSGDVGYLNFYQFIANSTAELAESFSTLKTAGITELVLDLRFNSGGRISVANELSSYIVGADHNDDVFTTYAFNDKYSADNLSQNFQELADSLSLNRVFVLQSDNTCSASELVINSLRPFMEVITIGETSCGKPYATSPNYGCGKVVNALQIDLLNANGVGGYFDGIPADCPVQADVRTALGDTSEPLLSEALRYIDVGSCAATARSNRNTGHRLTREFKQEWQGGNTL